MKPARINQFAIDTAYGDAITNSMFLIKRILGDLGFDSEVYVGHKAPEFADKLHSYEEYKTSKNQVLLIHHSIGHSLSNWLKRLNDLKIMVYHNITPHNFFTKNSILWKLTTKGREQLKELKKICSGVICDSVFNSNELLSDGYKSVEVIPLTIDIDKITNYDWDREVYEKKRRGFNLIFVGRVVENKCQHDLIKIFSIFKNLYRNKSHLFLIGSYDASSDYYKELKCLIKDSKLEDHVIFTGKVADEELYAYYKASDVFICMSEHEGFCVPIIEAMVFDLPVVAYNSSSIEGTLNGNGILLPQKDHKYIAGLISILSQNPAIRKKIVIQQRKNLRYYSYDNLKGRLNSYLYSLGIETAYYYMCSKNNPFC